MSHAIKWAVLGVVATAVEDCRESVECIREGFPTKQDAIRFAQEYHAMPVKDRRHVDVYCESYHGDRWQHQGGRCFIFARWILKENYDDLLPLCTGQSEPVVVIGECDLKGFDDKMTRGRHAWIEAGRFVIECGSYLRKPTYHARSEFYVQRNAVPIRKETIAEILAAADDD